MLEPAQSGFQFLAEDCARPRGACLPPVGEKSHASRAVQASFHRMVCIRRRAGHPRRAMAVADFQPGRDALLQPIFNPCRRAQGQAGFGGPGHDHRHAQSPVARRQHPLRHGAGGSANRGVPGGQWRRSHRRSARWRVCYHPVLDRARLCLLFGLVFPHSQDDRRRRVLAA